MTLFIYYLCEFSPFIFHFLPLDFPCHSTLVSSHPNHLDATGTNPEIIRISIRRKLKFLHQGALGPVKMWVSLLEENSIGKLLSWESNIIPLMEEILHQLIGSVSHSLQGFINTRWCRISSINSSITSLGKYGLKALRDDCWLRIPW